MKGALFLDIERGGEEARAWQPLGVSAGWEGPGAWTDLSSPPAQQIQFARAGSACPRRRPARPAIALLG